jgi:chromosome segregation ATPase
VTTTTLDASSADWKRVDISSLQK